MKRTTIFARKAGLGPTTEDSGGKTARLSEERIERNSGAAPAALRCTSFVISHDAAKVMGHLPIGPKTRLGHCLSPKEDE